MRRLSPVLIAFGTFLALVGGTCSGVGVKALAQGKNEVGAQLPVGFLVVGVLVLGGGGLLLFVGVRSERWRPTAQELARQQAGDYRTWYFRPVGLLLFLIALGAFVAVGIWLNQLVPGLSSGQHSPLGYVFAVVFVALLSFRRVRNLIFYTADVPGAGEVNKAGVAAKPAATADPPPDTASRDS